MMQPGGAIGPSRTRASSLLRHSGIWVGAAAQRSSSSGARSRTQSCAAAPDALHRRPAGRPSRADVAATRETLRSHTMERFHDSSPLRLSAWAMTTCRAPPPSWRSPTISCFPHQLPVQTARRCEKRVVDVAVRLRGLLQFRAGGPDLGDLPLVIEQHRVCGEAGREVSEAVAEAERRRWRGGEGRHRIPR